MRGAVGTFAVLVLGLLIVSCAPAPQPPAAQPAPTQVAAQPAPTKAVAAPAQATTAVAAPAPATQPAAAKPAAGVPDWVSDPQTYEAARKEGQVVLYTTIPQIHAAAIGKRFEERTGIKVEVTRVGSGAVVDRVGREQQAGLKVTDVVEHALAAVFLSWKRDGLLQPYLPREAAKIDEKYRDKDRMFNAFYLNVSFMLYNTKLLAAADAPRGWKDLYDPKWKGKMAVAHPQYGGTATDWALWQKKLFGWDFLQQLKANNPLVVKMPVEAMTAVINGERPFMAPAYSDNAWVAKMEGRPVEFAYPEEGTIVGNGFVSILKNAPHPNAAKLMVDFLFSAESQQYMTDQNMYVTIPNVKHRPDFKALSEVKTLVVDPQELERDAQEIRDRFSDVFGG